MTFELVYGVDVRGILLNFSSPIRWSGSRSQIWPETVLKRPKLKLRSNASSGFRAGNPVSGPYLGRILVGRASKSALRLSDWSPAEIRPGGPISGPEELSHNIRVPLGQGLADWALFRSGSSVQVMPVAWGLEVDAAGVETRALAFENRSSLACSSAAKISFKGQI